jgi:spore maturation protein CgeB
MEAAIRLAKVPQRTFRNVKLSGLGAGDLLGKLSQFSFEHSFDLAFAEGWHGAAPAAATVSKPLRRVAVVYPAYGGSMNLAQRSAEAAERLGFEVVRIDPSHRREEVRAALRSGGIGEKLYRSLEQECLSGIAEAKPQMLWILAQAFLSTGAIRTLRRQGMLTAYWFCEDYRLYPWRENALAVDAFYALQGGAFPGALRAAGVSVFPPLPACAASDACRLPLPDRPSRPLSFFGYPYRNRLRVFEALADLPLELFGERWDENATPLLKPLVRDASLLNEAQGFELFQQSAVNLNLHSSTVLNGVDPEGDYLNPRTFEIAACGGFQLCDRRLALPASFVDGAEIETFSSVGELREKLGRWMIDSQGRKLVAAAARRRVAAEHTYEHRLATVMQSLGVAVETKI